MIKGSPLRSMLQFALPLLIGNLLQQTYNIIDASIVGQILGAQALASVGASTSVQFLVLGFCMGSCTGFGIPVAKYFGAGDHKRMRDFIFNGAVLTAVIAVIVTTLCACSARGSCTCSPSRVTSTRMLYIPDDHFSRDPVHTPL